MTLDLYDNVRPINRNWIDKRYKKFYSKTMPHRTFYTFLKKYNPEYDDEDIFLVLSDVNYSDHYWKGVINNKRYIKIDIIPFIDYLNINKLKDRITEINVKLVEETEDYVIYLLEF